MDYRLYYRRSTRNIYPFTNILQLDELIFLYNEIYIHKTLNDNIKNNTHLKRYNGIYNYYTTFIQEKAMNKFRT